MLAHAHESMSRLEAKYGEPGNFGTGYWGRKIKDPAERKLKLTTELNNGRLAMTAMAGMLIQNGLTGQAPIEQLTAGHISPFNDGQGAFAQFDPSKELGACPPLGYWDPFGMMAFQDAQTAQTHSKSDHYKTLQDSSVLGQSLPFHSLRGPLRSGLQDCKLERSQKGFPIASPL